jgi:hypothetical protein
MSNNDARKLELCQVSHVPEMDVVEKVSMATAAELTKTAGAGETHPISSLVLPKQQTTAP